MKTIVTLQIPNSREAGVLLNNDTLTLLNLINQKIYSLMGEKKIIGSVRKVLQGGVFHYTVEMNDGYSSTDIERNLQELTSKIHGTSIQ